MQPILFIVVLLSWLSAASVQSQAVAPEDAVAQPSARDDQNQWQELAGTLWASPLAAHRHLADGSDKYPATNLRVAAIKKLVRPPRFFWLLGSFHSQLPLILAVRSTAPRSPPVAI